MRYNSFEMMMILNANLNEILVTDQSRGTISSRKKL